MRKELAVFRALRGRDISCGVSKILFAAWQFGQNLDIPVLRIDLPDDLSLHFQRLSLS